MNRIGLALSGGGFRATLYHLGLVRFLRDAGLLSQVTPLPLVYIALIGDYLWNEIDRPLERFRPIRANHSNPNKSISLSGY